jgi:hypothetical protein
MAPSDLTQRRYLPDRRSSRRSARGVGGAPAKCDTGRGSMIISLLIWALVALLLATAVYALRWKTARETRRAGEQAQQDFMRRLRESGEHWPVAAVSAISASPPHRAHRRARPCGTGATRPRRRPDVLGTLPPTYAPQDSPAPCPAATPGSRTAAAAIPPVTPARAIAAAPQPSGSVRPPSRPG